MPRPVELTFELLRTFLAVVDADGSQSGAAGRLGIGQPSMSRRLDHLREGGPVLTRPWLVQEGKTCKLTEEGQRVLAAVRDLVQGYDSLRSFVARPAQLAFSCGQEAAATFVQAAVRAFRDRPHTVSLRIAQLRGKARIEGVANGLLDLALVTDDEATILEVARRPLYTEVVAHDPLVLVCAREAPWAATLERLSDRPLPPRDLVKLQAPLIVPEPDAGIRQQFDQVLRKSGVFGKVQIQLEVGGWTTILSYVSDGLGVGLVSADVARRWSGADSAVIAPLDRRTFPATELRLIARLRTGHADTLDLSEDGLLFLDDLRSAVRDHFPAPTGRKATRAKKGE